MSRDWRHYLRSTSTAFGIPADEIIGRSHAEKTTRARHALFHILNRYHGLSRNQIARILRYHESTVGRSFPLTDWYIQHNPDFAARYDEARG